VGIELSLQPGDPADVAETVQLVVSGVEGVTDVRVTAAPAGPRVGRGRPLPVVGPPPTPAAPPPTPSGVSREEASRSPSEAEPLAGVTHVVAVSSGKGGVGKSTVSTNLAAAWAGQGYRVGLLDADVYGPDIPTMFGVSEKPRMHDDMVIPVEAHGVKLMSLGFLVDEETPAIWRGPIIMGIVRQFLQQVEWGELDFLVVDLPPGTGDAQLSLVQLVKVSGAVMVTTPQDVSVGGVLRGIKMFEAVDVPVLGVVENMRGFACPDCGTTHDIFGSGGGEALAASLGIDFLGAVPLGMAVREEGDRGVPTVIGRPDSGEAAALMAIARATESRIEALSTESSGP
jgi:ATP-binding protein involved in chromosome partitioning